MVVKSSSAPSSPSTASTSGDSLRRTSTSSSFATGHIKKPGHKETDMEFERLKRLVPTISKKQSVSQLDVILETIRYISQLQDQVHDRIDENKISVSASALIVGKENRGGSLAIMEKLWTNERQRHNSE